MATGRSDILQLAAETENRERIGGVIGRLLLPGDRS